MFIGVFRGQLKMAQLKKRIDRSANKFENI